MFWGRELFSLMNQAKLNHMQVSKTYNMKRKMKIFHFDVYHDHVHVKSVVKSFAGKKYSTMIYFFD